MGNSEDWQKVAAEKLNNAGYDVFNPRRESWDSSWEQSIHNLDFKEQVVWELDALDQATAVLMYLMPGTQSPISLLELGLHAAHEKMIVVCPDGFWRKGNVEVVCERFNIPLYESIEDAMQVILDISSDAGI